MSGHSKWANIKRQKQAADLARGNVFSKLSRIITLTVLESGGITNPENNVRLRLIIDKAKKANMPKENIKRAIDKGTGPDKSSLKEVVYEAFAHGKVVLIILATTDNANRTLSDVRNILERHGAKLAHGGAISYLFQKCSLISFKKNDVTENQVFDFAQKIDAFDIDTDETHFNVFFPFAFLGKINQHLGNLKYETAEVDYKPNLTVSLPDSEIGKIAALVDDLEELDDVHKVFANLQ